eukprot:403340881
MISQDQSIIRLLSKVSYLLINLQQVIRIVNQLKISNKAYPTCKKLDLIS